MVLALVGAADAGYMTWDHAAHKLDPRATTSLCQPGAGCEIARFHPLSEVRFSRWQPGIPISLLGLGFYLAMLALVARRLVTSNTDEDAPRLMLGMSIVAVIYSAFLGLVSMAIQGTLCPLCSVMYAVNALLLGLVWLARIETFTESFKRVWRSVLTRQALGALVAFSAAVVVGYRVYAIPVAPVYQAQFAKLIEESRALGAADRVDIETDGRPAFGDADAPVHIVEFADFACGHCRTLYRELHEVEAARPGQVKVTLMHFPLDTACNPHARAAAHPTACFLAAFSDCAAGQGRLEAFAPMLFDNGKWLDRATFAGSAAAAGLEEAGLDTAAFERCLDDPATMARVTASANHGAEVGVEGTPTFFVNGRMVLGARPLEMLLEMVDSVAQADGGTGRK